MYVKIQNCGAKSYKYTNVLPDHYPLFITLNLKDNVNNKDSETLKINYRRLVDLCSTDNWQNILEMDDPNIAIDTLIHKIKINIDKSIKKNRQRKFIPRKKWITTGIINSIVQKEELYKKIKSEPRNHDCKK